MPEALLPSCFFLPWAICRAVCLLVAGWLLDRVHPRGVLAVGFLLGGASLAFMGWPAATLTPVRCVLVAATWGIVAHGSHSARTLPMHSALGILHRQAAHCVCYRYRRAPHGARPTR